MIGCVMQTMPSYGMMYRLTLVKPTPLTAMILKLGQLHSQTNIEHRPQGERRGLRSGMQI
jgi:hypothetical protein